MTETLTPEVLWAQRSSVADPSKNFIYLTISVPDVPKEGLTLEIKPTKLIFTGASPTLGRRYHVELEFFAEIDPENSATNHTGKNIEFKLQKKVPDEEYWPRLLKDSKKLHFLKTDFDKWVDEDEQNEAPEDDFSQFGGMGGGMGGMGGLPGMGGDFGGIDFSKLGAGGGMPDLGGEDSDGDEDLPELGEPEAEAEAEAHEATEKAEDATTAKPE